MKFAQLTKTMNEQYMMVFDKEEKSVLAQGMLSNVKKDKMFKSLRDAKVIKFEELSEQDLLEFGMDPESEACVVILNY